jgi:magnesium transporter
MATPKPTKLAWGVGGTHRAWLMALDSVDSHGIWPRKLVVHRFHAAGNYKLLNLVHRAFLPSPINDLMTETPGMEGRRRHHQDPTRKEKVGVVPGSLVFMGKQRREHVSMRLMHYGETTFEEIHHVKEMPGPANTGCIQWLDIVGVHDPETMRKVGERYKLHPLVLEDIMNTGQRPKAEFSENYLFIVLKMIMRDKKAAGTRIEQVSFVVGNGWLLTFQEEEGDLFEIVRDRIRTDKGRVRRAEADYLAYALIDAIVDNYFMVLEEFGDQIENLESSLMSGNSQGQLINLQSIKREIISLRKSIWPMREVVNNFLKAETTLIAKETRPYLHDLYDHCIQIMDTIESYRDIIGGMQDLYLSVVNNKMNEVMKVLALISTIFLPMTLVAGIYGMNFKNMPELDASWGYPAAMSLMMVIGLSMYFLFKQRNWL